jgi:hypothetical protein
VPAEQGDAQDHPRRQSGERTGQGYDEEFDDA